MQRIAVPDSFSWVIIVVRQIDLVSLVAFGVFEYPPHRQCSAGSRVDQIDVVNGTGWGTQLLALRRLEDIEAPDLKPTTVFVPDIEAIHLLQFLERSFEEDDCAILLVPVVRSARDGFDDSTSTTELSPETSASSRLRVFALAASMAVEAAALATA